MGIKGIQKKTKFDWINTTPPGPFEERGSIRDSTVNNVGKRKVPAVLQN